MFKKFSIGAGALAMGLMSLAPVAAQAQDYYGRGYNDYYGRSYDDGYRNHDRAYRQAYRDGWNQGPRYYQGQRYYHDAGDYRYAPRRCQNGTAGSVIGAIAGGLLGRTIDTRGDRTLGTVLGAGAGALAGNAVARADNPAYCRR
ncbi:MULTISPECIES: glycine zipper 2TM domain-containing protein [Sphingomonas]|uniref:glycine zipper 2TM domain-containing protein n=1 Tax=Sphingomonas TaxID=13687 RepID=UPI00193B524D|nr:MULTISPECIES: glycine zipper 2TM domain-containing protein [Sphingomonas]